jgi:hypothetical protein
MVAVELRSPVFSEKTGQIEWCTRALVRAEDGDLTISSVGEAGVVVDRDMKVIDLATGSTLDSADEPEAWARNLPSAYRSADLVAVVVHDDDGDPPRATEAVAPDEVPDIASAAGPMDRATR